MRAMRGTSARSCAATPQPATRESPTATSRKGAPQSRTVAEAAGAAARVMARGESAADAQREAEAIAGDDAVVSVQRDDDRATAAVRLPAPGVLGRWESLEVSAEATTFSEEVIVDGS